MKVLKTGDRGKEVLDVQSRLRSLGYSVGTDGVDGLFGEATCDAVLLYQQRNGLLTDGVVGENTWCELVESMYVPGERLMYLRIPPYRGADALYLQRSLNCLGFNAGPEDGIFGSMTERAVLDFQKNTGLLVDGMVDDSVLKAIAKVTKNGELHKPEAKIPDRDGGYVRGRRLEDAAIVLDAAHGGNDDGLVTAAGIREKELNLKLARMLGKKLELAGSAVISTRHDDSDLSLYERSATANAARADVLISIHHNSNASPRAQGAAAYYFCRDSYYSEAGRMLADHIIDGIAGKLGIRPLPAMGRNYAMLREAEMTAVQVDCSFISVEGIEASLENDNLITVEMEGIFTGLRDYFEG